MLLAYYPHIDKCPYITHVLTIRLYLLNKKLKLLKRKYLYNIRVSQKLLPVKMLKQKID